NASFRGNYSVQRAGTSLAMDSFGGATPLGSGLLLPSPLSTANDAAAFAPNDATQEYEIGSGGNIREGQLNLLGDIAMMRGSHQSKFGFDYRRLAEDNAHSMLALYNPTSIQSFATNSTADSAEGILNKGGSISLHSVSIYGQDTWKVGRRFTLAYGVGW